MTRVMNVDEMPNKTPRSKIIIFSIKPVIEIVEEMIKNENREILLLAI